MLEQPLVERTLSGLHEALLQELPSIHSETPILDLGCGTGAWLERLASVGFSQLYGVDLDEHSFQAKNAIFFPGNLDTGDLEFKSKFGLITAIEVIEHLENPGNLLRFAAQNLEDNGYFLVTTPNVHSIDCRLKFLITGKLKSFDEKGDPTHINPVFLTAFMRILKRYPLQIERQWSYPRQGSLISRKTTKLAANLVKLFLPEPHSGDALCLLIRKKNLMGG